MNVMSLRVCLVEGEMRRMKKKKKEREREREREREIVRTKWGTHFDLPR